MQTNKSHGFVGKNLTFKARMISLKCKICWRHVDRRNQLIRMENMLHAKMLKHAYPNLMGKVFYEKNKCFLRGKVYFPAAKYHMVIASFISVVIDFLKCMFSLYKLSSTNDLHSFTYNLVAVLFLLLEFSRKIIVKFK